MALDTNDLSGAAHRLHTHILHEHWSGEALFGPDPGIRFNARVGRFLKTYLDFVSWSDDLVYLQAQGYWILDNWIMADLWDRHEYRDLARICTDYVLSVQHPEGYWDYPNPEWKGRVATVEGCFAGLGLLESYTRLGHEPFLAGAINWYKYLVSGIGFRRQERDGLLAVNYFAHNSGDGGGVPNNSTLALWFLAKLADASGDDQYLEMCDPMVAWLSEVQMESGELPYQLGSSKTKDRPHFLCFQYNAFEFMDLVHYYHSTGDQAVVPILDRLAEYLSAALTESKVARYDCLSATPEVIYYTSAVAQALSQATRLGFGEYRTLAEQAYERVLSQQAPNGGVKFYSRENYGVLSDRRSYPRYLAMILNHLLCEVQTRTSINGVDSHAVPAPEIRPAQDCLF